VKYFISICGVSYKYLIQYFLKIKVINSDTSWVRIREYLYNRYNKLPIVETNNDNSQNIPMDNLSNYIPHSCPVLPKDLELVHKLMNNKKIDFEAPLTTYISKSQEKKNKLNRAAYQTRFGVPPLPYLNKYSLLEYSGYRAYDFF